MSRKELQAENAKLKADLEQLQDSVCAEVEELKEKIAALMGKKAAELKRLP
jgi:uncharacterized small protein (DUF1192 family)